MGSDTFRFKQFTVAHSQCAMKVGVDAVLLGAWADCSNCTTMLDVGTGSGVIALMLAQRTPNTTQIYGIEIEEAAYLQAKQNAAQSKWQHRVFMLHGAFQQFSLLNYPFEVPKQFDLIVSNPPYFQPFTLPPDALRAVARHNTLLTHQQLLTGVAKLLNPGGLFCAILPQSQVSAFIKTALNEAGLHCHKSTAVRTLLHKPISRYLLQFGNSPTLHCTENELIMGGAHPTQFTPQCKQLTRDFYLHL